MSVTWIDDDTPLADCGNCGRNLPPTKVRQLFIYDSPNEVPKEIKSGEVNRSICPRCEYGAWLWPGMLVIDRTRRRAVFCYNNPYGDAGSRLSYSWTKLESLLEVNEVEQIRKRTVWVRDYRDIYAVLCESETHFSSEVAYGEKYRERMKIADLRSRAEQWMQDIEELNGVIMMNGEEASPEFLVVLREVIQEQLGSFDDQSKEALKTVCERFESIIQSRTNDLDDDRSSVESTESLPPSEDPQDDPIRNINLRRADVVTRALTKLVLRPLPDDKPADPVGGGECLKSLLEAQRCLFYPDSVLDSSLPEALEQMKADVPDVEVEYNNKRLRTADYLLEFDHTDNTNLAVLGEIALSHVDSNALFAAGVARYLARLWKRRGSRYSRFFANVLCCELFSLNEMNEHAIASLADSCLSFDTDQERKIYIPLGSMRLYAISWQRIGRYFFDVGDSYTATMCSAISAQYFQLEGDLDGEIRSRLDVVNQKIRSHLPITSKEVEQLLADIIGYGSPGGPLENHFQIQGHEVECLVQLALAQRTEWRGNPRILSLAMDCELKAKKDKSGSVELPRDFKLPIFDFGASEANEESSPPVASDSEGESSSDGTVLLTEVSFNNEPGYVTGVQIWSIDWINTLRRALKKSAEYKNETLWHYIYYLLIELSETIHAGIPIYFSHLMQSDAEKVGFKPPPDRFLLPLQLVLARCYVKQMRKGGSLYKFDEGFSQVLDLIETGVFEEALPGQHFEVASAVHSPEATGSTESSLNVTWDTQLMLAGLLEAGGRFEAAVERYQNYIRYCEEELEDAAKPQLRRFFANERVTSLYRCARACLKHYRLSQEYEFLEMALNAIEAYKARSILTDSDVSAINGSKQNRFTRFRTLEVEKVRSHFPENCFIVIFALLQETDINSGFWFSALINVRDQSILFPRFIEFDEVFSRVTAVSDAFNEVRKNLIGKTTGEIAEATRPFDDKIQRSLEDLGQVLFSEDVVAYLQKEGAKRLIIVPESYLFDVPFPALRVTVAQESRYLFELNDSGPSISVSPNLTHFQPYTPKLRFDLTGKELTSLATTLSVSPRWRTDVVPIFGVSKRLKQMFAGDAETGNHRCELDLLKDGVQDFLDSLVESKTALFFGHGEISEEEGTVLIADDGVIGQHEVNAYVQTTRFKTQLLILCACSSINTNVRIERIRKDVTGVHASLLKGGVRCIVGSVVPMFPICGIVLLQELLINVAAEPSGCDEGLLRVYRTFAAHPDLSSPLFWGHLIGFGDPFIALD
jgi:hypothetical protein